MYLVVYTDPVGGQVVALTPPTGMTAEQAQAQEVPSGAASFILDGDTLPHGHDIRSWLLDGSGNVTVDSSWKPPLRPQLKRGQIMRQLSADGKLAAARSAIATADPLVQELWENDDWKLAAIQQQPFASMISALSIDIPTFWAAAAQQPA